MAKSEIPSIVVQQSGCCINETGNNINLNGNVMMEGQQSLNRLMRLSKQEEFDFEEEEYTPSPVTIHIEDDKGCTREELNSQGNNHSRDDTTPAAAAASTTAAAAAGGGGGTVVDEDEPACASGITDELTVDAKKSEQDFISTRSTQRMKLLVRSRAVHDDVSPPPDPETYTTNTNTLTVTNVSTLALQSHTQSKIASRHLLGKQGSSQGSIEGSSPSLSRDSSTETYTDSTGIDLQQFIVDTLHKSQKDRLMLIKIEQDLITLVKDSKCQSFKFSAMSSYNRMLVHRVAAFFGLEHNVDKSGTSVIVNKTKNTRIPDLKFQDHIRDELVPDEPKKLILKRDSASFEEGKEV